VCAPLCRSYNREPCNCRPAAPAEPPAEGQQDCVGCVETCDCDGAPQAVLDVIAAEAQQDDDPSCRSGAHGLCVSPSSCPCSCHDMADAMLAHVAARPATATQTLRTQHQLQAGALASFAMDLEQAGEARASAMADQLAAFYTEWAANPAVVPPEVEYQDRAALDGER